MRKPIIAGNWKMNNTPKSAVSLINELKPLVAGAKAEVVLCPPFVCLSAAAEAVKGSNIILGAQNVHWAASGAFTGEISAQMLVEIGVTYVIIGHSERRQYFGETDKTVNSRSIAALSAGLLPIICVGETLDERERGVTDTIVEIQVRGAYDNISASDAIKTVIAYEPVWAIGTGRTATAQDANDVIHTIRRMLASIYDEETANKIRIQYGGSMNPSNAKELMAMEDIDGGLIGGASLKANDFAAVVNY